MERDSLKKKAAKNIKIDFRNFKHFAEDFYALNQSNKDIQVELSENSMLTIDLRCPLSKKRQIIPARTEKCTHFQTFDFCSYIDTLSYSNVELMNRGTLDTAKIKCPLCGSFAAAVRDINIKNLMNSHKDFIQVDNEGNYTEVKDEGDDVQPIVIELSDDEDDRTVNKNNNIPVITSGQKSNHDTNSNRETIKSHGTSSYVTQRSDKPQTYRYSRRNDEENSRVARRNTQSSKYLDNDYPRCKARSSRSQDSSYSRRRDYLDDCRDLEAKIKKSYQNKHNDETKRLRYSTQHHQDTNRFYPYPPENEYQRGCHGYEWLYFQNRRSAYHPY